ncbi:MAG TPA: molybdopterin-binding protein, partial [Phenylobacterium sp.]|nr:molybdopterin-binding protein [Phenylobacterium sp.]
MTLSNHRRGWLQAALASAGALVLGACDKITNNPKGIGFLASAEGLTRRAQRLVVDRKALAREFHPSDISSDFRPNGSIDPADADYRAHLAKGFADYRLVVDGLVERPLS